MTSLLLIKKRKGLEIKKIIIIDKQNCKLWIMENFWICQHDPNKSRHWSQCHSLKARRLLTLCNLKELPPLESSMASEAKRRSTRPQQSQILSTFSSLDFVRMSISPKKIQNLALKKEKYFVLSLYVIDHNDLSHTLWLKIVFSLLCMYQCLSIIYASVSFVSKRVTQWPLACLRIEANTYLIRFGDEIEKSLFASHFIHDLVLATNTFQWLLR